MLTVNDNLIVFDPSGGTKSTIIFSSSPWEIKGGSKIFSITSSGDSGGTSVIVEAPKSKEQVKEVIHITNEDKDEIKLYLAVDAPSSAKSEVITITPSSYTFPATGATIYIDVNCEYYWTTDANHNWVTVSPAYSEGSYTEIMVTAANNTGDTRSTTFLFTVTDPDETFGYLTLTQDAATSTFGISPTILNFIALGGGVPVNVTGVTTPWTAVVVGDGFSCSPTAGTYDMQVTVNATPNTGEQVRTGYVNFSDSTTGKTAFLSQAAGAPSGTFSLSPGGGTYSQTGETKTITVTSTYPWTASTNQDYVSFSPATGVCSTTVNISATSNEGNAPRQFTVAFRNSVGTALSYTGYQGQEIKVQPGTGYFDATGETKTTTVSCDYEWMATCSENWVTFSPSSGDSGATMSISVPDYNGDSTRVAYINFVDENSKTAQYTVVQYAKSRTISLRDSSYTYAASGQTLQTQVYSDYPWTGVSSESWASVSPSTGNNNSNIQIVCQENTSVNPRTFTITFTNSQGNTTTFSGTQVGSAAYIDIDSALLIIPSGTSSHNFNISYTSNVVVSSITASTSGTIINNLSFNSNKTVLTATFGANPDQVTKYLTITVSGEDENGNPVSDSCNVEQTAAAAVSISVNGNTVVPYNDTSEAFSITSNMSGTFSVYSSSGWCSVTNITQGGTSGSFTLSYSANNGSSARTSTITVSQNGATTALTFTQEAYGGSTYMSFNPSTATVSSGAGSYITSSLNVNGIDSLTIRLLPEASGNMSVSNCVYNATNRTLTIKYNKSNSTSTQSYTRTLQGTGYNNQTYTATFTLQQSPKASPVVPSVGDTNNPIWKTTYCVCNGVDSTDFEVYLGGDTIYAGRAFKYPDEASIRIQLNDICRNFLGNEFDWSAGYQTPSNWSRVFPVYVDGTLAGNYGFFKDWSYTEFYGARCINEPVVGEIPAGAYVPLCAAGNGSVSFTINGVSAASAVVNYNQKRYMVAAQEGSTYGSSDAGILYKGVAKCAVPYVLYYENAFSGFDALGVQGKVVKSSKITSYGMQSKVDRPSRDFEYNRYANECVRQWELNTKYLTDEQASKMHHLIESCMVYLYDTAAETLIPVVIDDNNCTWKTFKNQGRKFFNYTINVRESQTNIRK